MSRKNKFNKNFRKYKSFSLKMWQFRTKPWLQLATLRSSENHPSTTTELIAFATNVNSFFNNSTYAFLGGLIRWSLAARLPRLLLFFRRRSRSVVLVLRLAGGTSRAAGRAAVRAVRFGIFRALRLPLEPGPVRRDLGRHLVQVPLLEVAQVVVVVRQPVRPRPVEASREVVADRIFADRRQALIVVVTFYDHFGLFCEYIFDVTFKLRMSPFMNDAQGVWRPNGQWKCFWIDNVAFL